jgi:hypothetical protein
VKFRKTTTTTRTIATQSDFGLLKQRSSEFLVSVCDQCSKTGYVFRHVRILVFHFSYVYRGNAVLCMQPDLNINKNLIPIVNVQELGKMDRYEVKNQTGRIQCVKKKFFKEFYLFPACLTYVYSFFFILF